MSEVTMEDALALADIRVADVERELHKVENMVASGVSREEIVARLCQIHAMLHTTDLTQYRMGKRRRRENSHEALQQRVTVLKAELAECRGQAETAV